MAQPSPIVVDVPCRIIMRTESALIIEARGARHAIDARYIHHESREHITIPEWLAYELRLLTSERCLTVGDLALRFRASKTWVYANISRLEAEGFPQPVTTFGRKRWDPASVSAWFSRAARVAQATPQPEQATASTDQHDIWRSQLASAYGGA